MTELRNRLIDLFDLQNGCLFWRVSRGPAKAGNRAGTLKKNGYRGLVVDGKQILEHRAIFLMANGYLPETVDHINGSRSDNRVENLRGCSHADNNKNMPISVSNKSGLKNVSWYSPYKKWRVAVRVNGKQKCVGYFVDKLSAAKAAFLAREKFRGEFANHG